MGKRKYSDRADYLKKAVAKRRRKLREMALSVMGGKCTLCDYNNCGAALDFHHRNPDEKEFGISADGLTRAWKRVEAELKKCILLCANCHREVHAGVTQLPAETPVEE
jgi:hypothetical protein